LACYSASPRNGIPSAWKMGDERDTATDGDRASDFHSTFLMFMYQRVRPPVTTAPDIDARVALIQALIPVALTW
jgi:hypothetical protein